MLHYLPPLRDMQFVIEELLEMPARWDRIPAFKDIDVETSRQILEEAGRFAAEVLAPLNGPGDLAGCQLVDGRVSTPPGFAAAYADFVAGGWPALACDPAFGGQGLPQLINLALYEMLNSANHAWTMYPGLAHGAYECLKAHAEPGLRDRYLPQVVSGECLATMALTEPQAGSDLGLLRTRAEPQADGSWRVTGHKIFISGAEHDLTDNIVHLVLCRLPDAPPGTKGISLALVPKILPDGQRNTVRCDGIEKKMGIKGSATCAVAFEGAIGWPIGAPHRGLAAMFLMMNAARLQVSMQGLGHLEAATQKALRYATERAQMRAPSRPEGVALPSGGADLIVHHPAMRRTLLTLQAQTEASRVIAYWTAMLLDDADHHPDPAARRAPARLLPVLTPVIKACLTELGHQGADAALQVFGGYGFVHEYGIEQQVRDSRIAMIYEGTNEIQAIDLVMRKLLDDGGARFAALIDELAREAAQCRAGGPALADFAAALEAQCGAATRAAHALVDGRATDPEWPLRVADEFLRGVGFVLMAWAWARTARAIVAPAGVVPDGTADPQWRAAKLARARFGLEWLLPQGDLHWQRVHRREASLPWVQA
jgi:alkylation response protein AidB-like acyl-CoA dehydrogenase